MVRSDGERHALLLLFFLVQVDEVGLIVEILVSCFELLEQNGYNLTIWRAWSGDSSAK